MACDESALGVRACWRTSASTAPPDPTPSLVHRKPLLSFRVSGGIMIVPDVCSKVARVARSHFNARRSRSKGGHSFTCPLGTPGLRRGRRLGARLRCPQSRAAILCKPGVK